MPEGTPLVAGITRSFRRIQSSGTATRVFPRPCNVFCRRRVRNTSRQSAFSGSKADCYNSWHEATKLTKNGAEPEGAARGEGSPRATEPGYGAKPHLSQGAHSAPARERRGARGPRERPSRGLGRSPI